MSAGFRPPRGCTLAAARFVLTVLWLIVMIGASVAKLVEYEWLDYVIHLTNWAWTLQIVFLLLTLPAPACPDTAACVVAVCFFPLLGIAFFVATAVTVLLIDDPHFVVDLFRIIAPGVVMVFNDFVHYNPVLALVFFGALNAPLIIYSLERLFSARCFDGHPLLLAAVVLYELVGGGALFIGAYLATLGALGTTPQEVYDTDLSLITGGALYALVALVVNGSVLCLCAASFGVCSLPSAASRARWRRRIALTDFEAEIAATTATVLRR